VINVRKIREALEVQSDVLSMDSDELLRKYSTTIEDFDTFVSGLYTVMDDANYGFYFKECSKGIGDVLLKGYNSYLSSEFDIPEEDQFFDLLCKKYRYLANQEEAYHYLRHVAPERTSKLTEQNKCLKASEVGLSDPEYKGFLIAMPGIFEKIISGEGNPSYDPVFLSGITYIAMEFPEFAMTEDFYKNAGDLSRRRIRLDSIESANPPQYRKAGRCARRMMRKREKQYEKGVAKSLKYV